MEIQRPPSTQQHQKQHQPHPPHHHHSHHQSRQQPTASLQEHDPANLLLPAVPSHDLSTTTSKSVQLPCLRDLFSPELEQIIHRRDGSNGLPQYEPMVMSPPETVLLSENDVISRVAPVSHIAMDDPAVRIAAEALSGLSGPGFTHSPTQRSFHSPSPRAGEQIKDEQMEDPEPLLQLFAQAHPWLANTINGSMSAYNTAMNMTPGFVQNSANYVERAIAGPVVNTVGTVGRFTGVEDGIRRYLGGRRASEVGGERLSARALAAAEDVSMGGCEDDTRRDSTDSLPPYRASKPPSYREEVSPADADRAGRATTTTTATTSSWPTNVAGQVLVMTSGLTIALSVTSRRSLQYCLSLLSQATEHVATVTNALRMVLEQYDEAHNSWKRQHELLATEKTGLHTAEQDEASRRLAELIKRHCEDIWHTLKTVVDSVSKIAGGALPENARHFVRTQLMSLPQRWRIVSEQQFGESETSRTAHRMIAFATEGLDMMNQVSQVVRATLESAERWLDRVGRRTTERHVQEKKKLPPMDSTMRLM